MLTRLRHLHDLRQSNHSLQRHRTTLHNRTTTRQHQHRRQLSINRQTSTAQPLATLHSSLPISQTTRPRNQHPLPSALLLHNPHLQRHRRRRHRQQQEHQPQQLHRNHLRQPLQQSAVITSTWSPIPSNSPLAPRPLKHPASSCYCPLSQV